MDEWDGLLPRLLPINAPAPYDSFVRAVERYTCQPTCGFQGLFLANIANIALTLRSILVRRSQSATTRLRLKESLEKTWLSLATRSGDNPPARPRRGS
jgi:hypothetical protein